jgi:hypothetical protein
MQTSSGCGLFKGFRRMLTGDSFFITAFLNKCILKMMPHEGNYFATHDTG